MLWKSSFRPPLMLASISSCTNHWQTLNNVTYERVSIRQELECSLFYTDSISFLSDCSSKRS